MKNQSLWWLSNGCKEQHYFLVLFPKQGPHHIRRERQWQTEAEPEKRSWSCLDLQGLVMSAASPSDPLLSCLSHRKGVEFGIFDQGIILNIAWLHRKLAYWDKQISEGKIWQQWHFPEESYYPIHAEAELLRWFCEEAQTAYGDACECQGLAQPASAGWQELWRRGLAAFTGPLVILPAHCVLSR